MILWLTPLFLCWGSFLNLLGYRLIKNKSIIFPRSCCPSCNQALLWYDILPLISWVMLRGRCRSCKHHISSLYPAIEAFTAFLFVISYIVIPNQYLIAYFILFSSLIVSIRSDTETMLISRFVTLFLIPFGFLFSLLDLLPVTFVASLFGSFFGYGLLWSIAKIFYLITGKQGIGSGDFELFAFIGSFVGPIGCWFTLFIGSCFATCVGIIGIIFFNKNRNTRIPFGPFLAISTMAYILAQNYFIIFG